MTPNALVLASASPRRRELLTQAGFTFSIRAAEIDETPRTGEVPGAYVQRLAIEKAEAVLALSTSRTPVTVLAADTAVVTPEGTILGKPVDRPDAARMLALLSGRTHAVLTGLAVLSSTGLKACGVETTRVSFSLITPREIAVYVDTGEPMDKAGAYAIQGFAARWIPRIEGDYFNVVGLPIARVVTLLTQVHAGAETHTVSDLPHSPAT